MPYVATTMIAHPQCVCGEGQEVRRCPSPLLRRFLQEGLVKMIGEEGPPESLIVEQDELTSLKQKQLVKVILLNSLQKFVKPMDNWTDEQIRQAIRDHVADLSTLKMPPDAPTKLIPTEELS